jgi:hypothetical protein
LEVSIFPFVVGLVVFDFVSRFLFAMAVDFDKMCGAGRGNGSRLADHRLFKSHKERLDHGIAGQ